MLNILNLLFNESLVKFGVFIVIILAGIIVGKIAGRAIKKLAKEVGLNKIFRDLLKVNLPLGELSGKIVSWVIYLIAILFALDQIGLGSATLNIILIFVLIIIVIIILLSIKDFIPNIISGIVIYSKGNIKKGVRLRVNNITGTVISVSLLETKIKTKKEFVFIPNSILVKNSVIVKK